MELRGYRRAKKPQSGLFSRHYFNGRVVSGSRRVSRRPERAGSQEKDFPGDPYQRDEAPPALRLREKDPPGGQEGLFRGGKGSRLGGARRREKDGQSFRRCD